MSLLYLRPLNYPPKTLMFCQCYFLLILLELNFSILLTSLDLLRKSRKATAEKRAKRIRPVQQRSPVVIHAFSDSLIEFRDA